MQDDGKRGAEKMQDLKNAIAKLRFSERLLYDVARPSVCLSVCLSSVCNARAPYTQPVEIFGNVYRPFSTLAIH